VTGAARIGVLVGAAGFSLGLTALYRGMRSVMIEAGGFCASGGPYEIANECSGGQITLTFVGVLVMLFFGAVFAGSSNAAGGSGMGAGFLMWAALFGALGFNFLQLGFDPPDDSGLAWGWIVPGVLFELMALGGLIPAIQMAREWAQRGGEQEEIFKPPLVRAQIPGRDPEPPRPVGQSVPVEGAADAGSGMRDGWIWLTLTVAGSAAGVAAGQMIADSAL
jgi:hypothetical protein